MVTAREALLEASNRHLRGYGSLSLFNKADKRQAKIYLLDAKVYAVEILDYEPPIIERLNWVFKEQIDLDDVHELARRTSPANALRYALLRNQIITAETSNSISRDFFINLADDILSWSDVKSSWKDEDSLSTKTGYQIHPAKTSDLLAALTKKEMSITNFCNDFDIDVTQLGGIYILPNREAYNQKWELRVDSDNYVSHVVKNAKDAIPMKEIISKSKVFGLFNLVSSVHALYEKGLINYNVNGRIYSNLRGSQDQILLPATPANVAEESDVIPVVHEVASTTQVPQTPDSPAEQQNTPVPEVRDIELEELTDDPQPPLETEAPEPVLPPQQDFTPSFEESGLESLALLPEMPNGGFAAVDSDSEESQDEGEIEYGDLDSLIKNIRVATVSLSKQIKASEERENELEDKEKEIVRKISELEQERERATHALEAQRTKTMELEIKLSRIRSPLN